MRTPATQRRSKKSLLSSTTKEKFKKFDEIEKNLRQQLLLIITGKNHLTDEDRNVLQCH